MRSRTPPHTSRVDAKLSCFTSSQLHIFWIGIRFPKPVPASPRRHPSTATIQRSFRPNCSPHSSSTPYISIAIPPPLAVSGTSTHPPAPHTSVSTTGSHAQLSTSSRIERPNRTRLGTPELRSRPGFLQQEPTTSIAIAIASCAIFSAPPPSHNPRIWRPYPEVETAEPHTPSLVYDSGGPSISIPCSFMIRSLPSKSGVVSGMLCADNLKKNSLKFAPGVVITSSFAMSDVKFW